MWQINETLYYAQVITREDRPPVCRVLIGTYRGRAKNPNCHRLKCDHAKYPLIVESKYLKTSPSLARAILMTRIADAINRHASTIDQLWEALAASDRTAAVTFSREKIIRRKELPMTPESTTINSLANLQNLRQLQATRDSLQARLIAAHQRRPGKNPPSVQHITSTDMRHRTTELPTKINMLGSEPEKATPLSEPMSEPPPIDAAESGPIPRTPRKHAVKSTQRAKRKPPIRRK